MLISFLSYLIGRRNFCRTSKNTLHHLYMKYVIHWCVFWPRKLCDAVITWPSAMINTLKFAWISLAFLAFNISSASGRATVCIDLLLIMKVVRNINAGVFMMHAVLINVFEYCRWKTGQLFRLTMQQERCHRQVNYKKLLTSSLTMSAEGGHLSG